MSTLVPPKSPLLPISPTEFSQQYGDQLNNALRLYFNQLDNRLSAFLGKQGGQYVNNPYGAFSSVTTQTVATIQTPTKVTFDAADYVNGTSLATSTVTIEASGLYNVQFSMQITNADTQSHDVDVYFKKNGSVLANTASVVSVQGTHGGQPGYQVLAANFFIPFVAGNTLEMWWVTNSVQVSLNYLPAITSPFISPGAPSVVLTLSFVSSVLT
jgi:hypothetical protein